MKQANPLEQLADVVRDLTEPFCHDEELPDAMSARHFATWRHRSEHASLLEQLAEAVEPGSSTDEAGLPGPRVWESSPPISESAMDAQMRIEVAVARWLSEWCRQALRSTLSGNLHALVGAASVLDPQLQRALVRDAKAWRVWCRVEAGWDRRTMTPRDPCPCCLSKNSLRVRGDGTAAWCVQCGEAWAEDDPDLPSVMLLAEMLRNAPVADEEAEAS